MIELIESASGDGGGGVSITGAAAGAAGAIGWGAVSAGIKCYAATGGASVSDGSGADDAACGGAAGWLVAEGICP